jgi:hypothetical protein
LTTRFIVGQYIPLWRQPESSIQRHIGTARYNLPFTSVPGGFQILSPLPDKFGIIRNTLGGIFGGHDAVFAGKVAHVMEIDAYIGTCLHGGSVEVNEVVIGVGGSTVKYRQSQVGTGDSWFEEFWRYFW